MSPRVGFQNLYFLLQHKAVVTRAVGADGSLLDPSPLQQESWIRIRANGIFLIIGMVSVAVSFVCAW